MATEANIDDGQKQEAIVTAAIQDMQQDVQQKRPAIVPAGTIGFNTKKHFMVLLLNTPCTPQVLAEIEQLADTFNPAAENEQPLPIFVAERNALGQICSHHIIDAKPKVQVH